MGRNKLVEKEGLVREQIQCEFWPEVEAKNLSIDDRNVYLSRRKALELYFQNEMNRDKIREVTGISPRNLHRIIKRCISFDPTGRVWGWRGLIPDKHLKKYELNSCSEKRNESRKTGEFLEFLQKYPDIEEKLENMYLGRNQETLEPVMRPKYIFKKFIEECRKKKIPPHQYPFNTDNKGRRAIYRYLKELKEKRFVQASIRFGHDAQQKTRNAGIGEQNSPEIVTPYQRTQFDGHRIDGIFAIRFKTPEGEEVTRVLQRIWILTIKDVATRNILGKHICVNKEYSASDVLLCARDAITPHKKKSLTIPNLSYHEVGGYPSEVFPETEWAVWDELCFDNAKAHLANIVQDRLHELVGCTTNFGPVDMPMRRSFIERFFKTLEENGFHRLPNTTGGSIFDSRRDNPEEKAIKWFISLDHLEELIDVLISDYNGTPNGGIYYLSPLEALQQRLSKGMLPRILEETRKSNYIFLQTNISRFVRGNIAKGKRPYIYYEGVEYRNDFLAGAGDLIGTELTLHINIDDLRTVRAFLPDGSELGVLAAAGKWSLTPHTLQMRRHMNQLVHRKLLHFSTWDDPIFCYTVFLKNEAARGKKKDANKYAHAQKVIDGDRNERLDPPEKSVLESEKKLATELDEARNKMKESQTSNQTNTLVRKYNAITY